MFPCNLHWINAKSLIEGKTLEHQNSEKQTRILLYLSKGPNRWLSQHKISIKIHMGVSKNRGFCTPKMDGL